MAMTQAALIFLGALAILCTIGMFIDVDRWTRVLVTFLASIVWGLVGLSAFDVIVATSDTDPPTTLSEPIMPLVILGLGLAFMCALYGFYDLVVGVGNEAKESSIEELMS